MKCARNRDVSSDLQPVAATPQLLEGLRARLSLESNAIWTDRRLEALVTGVRGKRGYSLRDKVWNPTHLYLGAWQVIRKDGAPGVDPRTCEQLEKELSEEVSLLERRLRAGTFKPQAVKRVWIKQTGRPEKRPLGIPSVRDRVVPATLRNVMEPIFEAEFGEHSYGFGPGRGATQALSRVETQLSDGDTWGVDADIQGYFDNIPPDRLMSLLRQRISDGRVLALSEAFLTPGVMERGRDWQPTTKGTPQGAVLSPLLANGYLHPLDLLAQSQGGRMTRYADDFIVQCSSRAAAETALAQIRVWREAAGLTLHPEKTRIVDATGPGGFDFLGWHFERGLKWPREKSLARFKETLREQTPRNSGRSLDVIIERLNRRWRGWYRSFQGGVKNVYRSLDEWRRGRLRSILRRRDGRKGRGRGRDHNRYPIAYFANLKLISLYASACGKRFSPAARG